MPLFFCLTPKLTATTDESADWIAKLCLLIQGNNQAGSKEDFYVNSLPRQVSATPTEGGVGGIGGERLLKYNHSHLVYVLCNDWNKVIKFQRPEKPFSHS